MPSPFSAKRLADILGGSVGHSTHKRRRTAETIRRLADDCRDGGPTNRVRFVVARCVDLGRLARADQTAFERFVAEVLDETS